jgi:hypothetical protein
MRLPLVLLLALVAAAPTEHFDADPNWDAHQNRIGATALPITVKQDFGYHAEGKEIGGLITPAAEAAYYAKHINNLTFQHPFKASGKLRVPRGAGNTLIGFFNRDTLNEWRTPNTVALRINSRGEGFHAYLEYCTSRWRAGGDLIGEPDPAVGKKQRLITSDVVHTWSLEYDPAANDGAGAITAAIDGEQLRKDLEPGHKRDGATFNRFGILNVLKSVDAAGQIWMTDLVINGDTQSLDADPKWDGFRNRQSYETRNVRPRFDFGYSPTNYAGGAAKGEIGGSLFRGDQRFPERMAYYGAVLRDLSLNDRLEAGGKMCLRRGVTDSTILFGFFQDQGSRRVGPEQKSYIPENFVGIAIEGPSADGFYFYPVYGVDKESVGNSAQRSGNPPTIYPDGKPHDWTLLYEPGPAGADGKITLTLDGKPAALVVPADHKAIGAHFNRFGFITTHIDGNGQEVYLDDLIFTR